MNKSTKLLPFLGGFFLGALGLLISGIGLLGFIDPAGAKMADDGNPFGPITTSDYFAWGLLIVIGIAIGTVGVYLMWSVDKKV